MEDTKAMDDAVDAEGFAELRTFSNDDKYVTINGNVETLNITINNFSKSSDDE